MSDIADFAALVNNRGGYGADGFGYGGGWFMWIIVLFLFWGRNGWGENGVMGSEMSELLKTAGLNQGQVECISSKINELSGQISTSELNSAINGNSDAINRVAVAVGESTNTIQQAICSAQARMAELCNQTGLQICDLKSAVAQGNLTIVQSLKDCCCNLAQSLATGFGNVRADILTQTNALATQMSALASNQQLANCGIQNSINTTGSSIINAITTGFAQTGYTAERNANAIIQANDKGVDRILAYLNQSKVSELENLLAQANLKYSQAEQTNTLLKAIAGNNSACCGSNYGCGCGGC